ncbi:hypothetical protein [Cryptosporangium sp. NPDC048952]|uniref:hypothetical protein n=1 Tax=Cryptosporangium sp. NPDC048952 TaxID=3363961 RepID=UPI00371D15C5
MRRTRWLLFAVLVVVLVGGSAAVIRAWSGDDTASSCDVPDTAPDARSEPAGDDVRVVESGWSPTAGGVALAAVVQNTSKDRVAYRTRITFTPAGPDWFLEIPVLLPGQRVGAATWIEGAVSPSRPGVVVGQTHWLDAGKQGFRSVTATYRDAGGVTVTSPYCRNVARHGVSLLFRDSTGKLLGGARIDDGPDAVCRPGARTDSEKQVQGVPAGADPSRTEAYAYCDPARVDRSPTGPAGVNYSY